MLRASPIGGAEEFAIHDYEGFGSQHVGEQDDFETVSALGRFVREHGAIGTGLLAHLNGDVVAAREAMADGYLDTYASLADYVQEITEGSTGIPESLRFYIDWSAMARDTEMDGDLFAVQTAWDAVHVFARGEARTGIS